MVVVYVLAIDCCIIGIYVGVVVLVGFVFDAVRGIGFISVF